MKQKIFFLSVTLTCLLLVNCRKNETHGPYDPSGHIPKFSAKLNGVDFESYKITISTPDNLDYPIGVFSDGIDNHWINIYFPKDCGVKMFGFPNASQNVALMLDNVLCKSGRLTITKYDSNFVEGTFEFNVDIESTNYNITEGYFSIIYRID